MRAFVLVFLSGLFAFAHTSFIVASSGCAAAHCGNFAGNQDPLPPPINKPSGSSDSEFGRSLGLGCVSNNAVVACTYAAGPTGPPGARLCPGGTPTDTLVIYDNGQNIVYKSGCLLDGTAQSSAPLINSNGDVITADSKHLIRVNYNSSTHTYPSNGIASVSATLSTLVTGSDPGSPVSPIILKNGTMVAIATRIPGDVSVYWADDLTKIGQITVTGTCSNPDGCPYESRNTPAASYNSDNRFYVSMNAYVDGSTADCTSAECLDAGYGKLIAFDVNPSVSPYITATWVLCLWRTFGRKPCSRSFWHQQQRHLL